MLAKQLAAVGLLAGATEIGAITGSTFWAPLLVGCLTWLLLEFYERATPGA